MKTRLLAEMIYSAVVYGQGTKRQIIDKIASMLEADRTARMEAAEAIETLAHAAMSGYAMTPARVSELVELVRNSYKLPPEPRTCETCVRGPLPVGKRLHGDPDRIMEHAEAGYCLSHSEELHLCKYTRSLRDALAEKTAQVEAHKYALGQVTIQRDEARAKVQRLREALEDLVDMCETEFTFGGPPVCDFDLMVLPSAREALAATAPDVDNKEVQ